ncbi:MAG: type VI secretion system tip protein VgrG [Pseudomonadales bacterium]|nr:type VI secretion system tip protein VgrG [Pseudomonadales bacterium]
MSVVTITVLSDGEAVDVGHQLVSLDITKELNRIPVAELQYVDGDATDGSFNLLDDSVFDPGKAIEIKLRYEGIDEDSSVFKGLVLKQAIKTSSRGSSLCIEIKDSAIKLTQGRKSAVYYESTDSDVISTMITDAGLTTGTIEVTNTTHSELVQYYSTDWDFMLSRVDANGQWLMVNDGEISVKNIAIEGDKTHAITLGIDSVYDLEVELDASAQYSNADSFSWDYTEQKMTTAANASEVEIPQGTLTGEAMATAVGFDALALVHPAPLEPEELQSWVDARMARSRMAKIRGRFCQDGRADILPLDLIDLQGAGEKFKGLSVVTAIRHSIGSEGWRTDVQFGFSATGYREKEGIQDTPAAGLLPAVQGLQIGIVDKFEEDANGEYRAKVFLAAINDEAGTIWARVARPDAGKNRGLFFQPEIGDEVVVGFFNNDPRQAVILGAMHSSVNNPAPAAVATLGEDNINKGIVTKKGTVLGFVDNEKASVYIQTASGSKILIDDEQQIISLADEHGNEIIMSSDGIEIKSSKDLKLSASGNVEITGSQVDIK